MADWSLPGYTEVERLGEGGFGRVVLAEHQSSGVLVAIKYLYAEFLAEPSVLEGFRREARLLAGVHSPFVARLFEFVETAEGAALVMEAVPGVPLRSVLAAAGALAPESALAVLKGSLLGLAAAHQVGVVHRDYKPDNVLVSTDRASKLVDFGLAVLDGRHGLAAGTPAYMAPEQWAGAPGTPATDVYAATCVFFQCVTGHRPFETASDSAALKTLHEFAPVPFGQVPEPVRRLVAWGMAKDPGQRPATADAFVAELERSAQENYGPDWERRGWSTLAKRAAALVALSPVALLATTATAAAPVAGAAAATAGGTASTGILGAAAVKITAALVGLGALVGAGLVVYDQAQQEPPAVEQVALKAEVTAIEERLADPPMELDVEYVRVSEHPDPVVQRRINGALREPADQRVASVRESMNGNREQVESTGDVARLRTRATITARTDKLISVRYEHQLESEVIWHSTWTFTEGVTVDLDTGRPLGAREVLRPETLQDRQTGALAALLIAHTSDGGFCGGRPESTADPADDLADALLRDAGSYEHAVTLAFTERGVQFYLDQLSMGYSTACGRLTVDVPYAEITGLLNPALVGKLPKAAHAPASSSRAPSATSGAPRPDGVPLKLRGLTLTVPAGWTRRDQGLEDVVVVAGCADPERYFDCPRFLVTDNSRSSAEQPRYRPGAPYVRSAGGRACNAVGRKDLKQLGEARRVAGETVQVGGRPARFERWEIGCVREPGAPSEATLTQRIWFLPGEELVILDEWNVERLPEILAGATVR